MSDFIITGVPKEEYYHIQTNNKLYPYITCFPTSVAMAIDYILTIEGKTPASIGIDEPQIEDYLTKMESTSSIKAWMIKTLGSWATGYLSKSWLVGAVEEKAFDDLMNKIGYDGKFTTELSYGALCKQLKDTNLPQVICGDFSSVSQVGGHINCAIGFDFDNKMVITSDPYGYAFHPGYTDPNNSMLGCGVKYSWNQFFMRNKNGNGWGLLINKK